MISAIESSLAFPLDVESLFFVNLYLFVFCFGVSFFSLLFCSLFCFVVVLIVRSIVNRSHPLVPFKWHIL